MIKIVVIAVVVLGAVGGFVLLDPVGGDESFDRSRGTYVVKRQTLKVALTERGTLKTKNSTQIRSRASAKIEWLVEEGKSVKKDDILVELEKKDTENRKNTLEDQLTQLEAELNSATTEEIVQIGQNKTDIEKAELGLAVADVELKKLMKADIPAEERKLALAVEEKMVALDEARDKLKAYEQLLEEEFATQQELEKAKLELKRAQNDLTTAEMDQQSYVEFQRPLDIRKKEAGLQEAKRGLERASKRAEAQLSSKKARVQQKKVSQSRVKSHYERVLKQLENMTLKAPTDGTVLYGDPDEPWMANQVKVGGQVWHNMVLITLPDPSEMGVIIEVHEADIDQVKKEMKAFVTSETQKDTVYEGKVIKIDAVANAGRRGWGGDNVKRFKVEVALEGRDLGLKTGTSARVEIQIGEVADVVAVPLQAVFTKEGKRYCFKVDGGMPTRVEVVPGTSNDSHVEIKSGLEEGDHVILYDPEIAGEGEGADSNPANGDPSKQ